MIKRIIPVALLGAALISNTGCKNGGGFQKYKGLEYKIIKDMPGKNAAPGDIVEFNIVAMADTFHLQNSREQMGGKPAVLRVEESQKSGDLQAVFTKLSVGDSAIVEIPIDTLMKNMPPQQQQMPPWFKKGKKITINLSIVSIKSMDDYKKEMEAKQAQMQQEMKEKADKQLPVDDKILQDYFAKNNIKAQKTASGLYYTIEKTGSGPAVTQGQVVSMMYTGKTLDGKVFDSNRDTAFHHAGQPLTFKAGMHQMIPGMDEGVTLLKKGGKATLYLPSPLAYGEQGPPNIGPNAILIFDVEITDVKAGGPDKEQMPAQ
jgi:FKBP-type peptidyl-prolyl cis-trans isomerase FkpA